MRHKAGRGLLIRCANAGPAYETRRFRIDRLPSVSTGVSMLADRS